MSTIKTDIPLRLDRLPWDRFHILVVVALGVTWILDGLEVTLAGAVSGALKESPSLQFSNAEVGLANSAYLAGAVLGAILFGWLTDRLGRRKLIFITLATYGLATAGTAFTTDIWSFALLRFVTGAGIGGEYTAINSAIQELLPARVRGWSDLAINGSFWIGAALGAAGSILLLDPQLLGPDIGWRTCFLIGAILVIPILFMRRWIPESPRWLLTHGRAKHAEEIVVSIEQTIVRRGKELPPPGPARFHLREHHQTSLTDLAKTLFVIHRRRALVGLSLMAAQAFFYNAIFFTYALVLTDFYGVAAENVGWYILPFAIGNVLGPLLLGRLFDTIGRRPMVAVTYIVSGILLTVSGLLFQQGVLDGATQTITWMIVFFFASAAASSAYLTVSETFPLEIRALAIAAFYAIGTGLGGVAAPALFGFLIESGSRDQVLIGYLLGALLMVSAGIVQAIFGVAAERRTLEDVARPISAVD